MKRIFTIDRIPFLETEATAIKCIRIENSNSTTNRINPDASQEIHHSSQTFPNCTDTDDNCEKIIKVTSNLNSSTPNSIGNTIIATKSNSEDIEIKVSVMVN